MNKKVLNNAIWLIICRIFKALLAAVVSVMTARFFGPDDFGLLNYSHSIVAFLSPLVLMGFNSILVQEILEDEKNEGTVLGTAMLSSIGCSFVGIGVAVLFSYVMNPSDDMATMTTAMCSISLVFNATELIQYWFQAKFRSKTVAIIGVFSYFIVSIYKFILLISNVSVVWFAISNALDYMLTSLVLVFLYYKEGNARLRYSFATFKSMFKVGGYYVISTLMINIFAYTDKLMLKNMLGNTENGYYSAATACAALPVFVFVAIIEVMRPYILEGKRISERDYEERMVSLYSLLVYLTLACSLFVSLLSKPLIYIMYGEEYAASAGILCIVIWNTALSCIGGAKDVWILAEKKQKYLLYLNASGAVLNMGINFFLIPILGGVGAAIATLATQLCSNIILCLFIKELRRNMYLLYLSLNPLLFISGIKQIIEIKKGKKNESN